MAEVLEEAVQVEAGNNKDTLITVLGPTASGKTQFATRLAYELGREIISADSRQIYRQMDIGTGKDLSEYDINGMHIPYHLIDIRNPGDKYTLFNYQHDFHAVYDDILSRGKEAILCGGTGLYIESVLKGYNLPDVPPNQELRSRLEKKNLDELSAMLAEYGPLHNTTDIETKNRAIRAIEIADYKLKQDFDRLEFEPIESLIIGIDISRELRREKITKRLKQRLDEGMVDEVREILDTGVTSEDLIYYGLEYKFVTQYVIGEISYEEMFGQLETAIHRFAKRQMTWFRGMERRGFKINWIDATLPMNDKVELAISYID